MCGIAGWLGALEDSQKYAAHVSETLRHRGPDSHGIRSCQEATLIHTRLSIIDLSPTAAQPMANEDGTVWTVFNGEIYNHRELRRRLETSGHLFKSRADTEVLPHLYEEEGPDFVNNLRGMFALAIYDTHKHNLLLARDRFGIKPLFYAPGPARLAFASEIRALLELPEINTRPDKQAIYDFAALFYIPAPETFYAGIRALQPGELLEAHLEPGCVSWRIRTYHEWKIAPNPTITLSEAVDQTDALLTASVGNEIESDVPLGTLLSGGIDSSLVSVVAQAASGGDLRTFNVSFCEKEYDETWAAVAVADYIGSKHETLAMDGVQGTWDHVTNLLLHAGQPFADTSLFPFNAVCRLMRQHVTVALSGDGGDEGFGGYDLYWQIGKVVKWQTWPTPIQRGSIALLDLLSRFRFQTERLSQRMRSLIDADDTSIILNLLCWIREDEHSQLCRDTHCLPVRRLFERQWDYRLPPVVSRLERLSAHATEVLTRLSLPNDYLFKVDTASMKESLEVRVPMLDEDLFAFGLSLPHRVKVAGRTCKRVLRELAKRRLPRVVAEKPKWGFGIPLDDWVNVDFKARLRNSLLGHSSDLPDFFRPETYRPIVEAFCDDRPCRGISRQGLYQRAIMLLSLQLALGQR